MELFATRGDTKPSSPAAGGDAMKTKTYYIMLALAILFCSIETADACSLNPTAVITTDPDGTVFYNGDPVLLSGENSTANCGFITQYLWRVRPEGGSWTTIYTGSSPTYSYTFPILNDGESEKSYQIMLRVRNSSGRFGYAYQWVTVKHSHESYYYLTDHLGSVRVTVDERGDPVGWDDYYPFGLQMPGRSQQQYGSPETDVKYTGYELNQEGGLGLYHAGARLYDPEVGRFMQQDPLTGKYPGWSPYVYALNNPLIFIDPDGREVVSSDSAVLAEIAQGLNANEKFKGAGIYVSSREVDGEKEYYLAVDPESGFDWGRDVETEAFYDVIVTTEAIFDIVFAEKYKGATRGYWNLDIKKSLWGGKIDPKGGGRRGIGGTVWLHPEGGKDNTPVYVVFSHEVVGHGHPSFEGRDAYEIERWLGYTPPRETHATGVSGFLPRVGTYETGLYKKKKR